VKSAGNSLSCGLVAELLTITEGQAFFQLFSEEEVLGLRLGSVFGS